jgi:hypothetical protein
MNAKLLRFFIAFLLVGCGAKSDPPASSPVVSIDFPPAPAATGIAALSPPTSVANFQCLFVNVMGEGIGDWEKSQGVVAASTRGYIGAFSGLIVPSVGGKMSVAVPAGKSRIIQVIGVKVDGFTCPAAQTANDLYSTSVYQEMYQIARVTTDVTADLSLEMTSTYDSATAVEARYRP